MAQSEADLKELTEVYNREVEGLSESHEVPEPPATVFELPGGYQNDVGEIVREVQVRELNGEDEEILARIDVAKNPGKWMTTLLLRNTVAIGGEEATKDMVQSLNVGDRNFLLYVIRKVSFGNMVDMFLTCPSCGMKNDIGVDLDTDVTIKVLDDDQRMWEVNLPSGKVATVRLPTGRDQESMFSTGTNKNVPEMNTLLLANCVLSVDQFNAVTQTYVRQLSARDRKEILEFISDKTPGPQYEDIKTNCAGCDREFVIPVDMTDLFRN